jgi:hypothetical protein
VEFHSKDFFRRVIVGWEIIERNFSILLSIKTSFSDDLELPLDRTRMTAVFRVFSSLQRDLMRSFRRQIFIGKRFQFPKQILRQFQCLLKIRNFSVSIAATQFGR